PKYSSCRVVRRDSRKEKQTHPAPSIARGCATSEFPLAYHQTTPPNGASRSLEYRDCLDRRAAGSLAPVYSDRRSGAQENRPGLKCLLEDALRGQFDVVLVWRFDRLARSIEQLVTALAEFRSLGIDFVSCQEALDTSTPMGKAMFTIIGAMAELERNVIRDRVVSGLEYARRNGTKSGAPIGRPKAIFDRAKVSQL